LRSTPLPVSLRPARWRRGDYAKRRTNEEKRAAGFIFALVLEDIHGNTGGGRITGWNGYQGRGKSAHASTARTSVPGSNVIGRRKISYSIREDQLGVFRGERQAYLELLEGGLMGKGAV